MMEVRRDLTVLLTSLCCTTALFWTLEPSAQDNEAAVCQAMVDEPLHQEHSEGPQ